MKKINTFTFVAAIAMSVGLLASCGNKSSGGSQGGKDKEVSYTQYMKALEDVDKETFPYAICYIDGTITHVGDPEPYVTFTREPVRFVDAGRPSPRPQASDDLGDFVFNYLFRNAWGYSEEDVATYFINKKDDEHKYKVVYTETVGIDQKSELTITYNSLGFPTSIKNGAAYDVRYRVTRRMVTPLKDLTITWSETDTIDSYTKIKYSAFNEKALENERKEQPFYSGRVNGTFKKYNSEFPTTLENEILIRGYSYFYSHKYETELNIVSIRASSFTYQANYFFYYSESLGNLMIVMEMSDRTACLERIITWNSNGLVISVVDSVVDEVNAWTMSEYFYSIDISYSTDAATVTLTLLSGAGAWADGSEVKYLTLNAGSYLGNFPIGWEDPTATGMSAYGGCLATLDGDLVFYGTQLFEDMTLVYPFYKSSSTPAEFKLSAHPGQSLAIRLNALGEDTPILINAGSANFGFYQQNGQDKTLEYTVPETCAEGTTITFNVYGTRFAFSNSEGALSDGASMVTSISLAGSGEVDDYAFKGLTNLTTVSVRGPNYSRIGDGAFEGCEYLEELYGTPIEIGTRAFYGCRSLGSTVFLTSTASIADDAFVGCSNLTLVTNGTVEYNGTYAQNRFVKRNQTYPDGWCEGWSGDAKVMFILSLNDFYHEGSLTEVGTSVPTGTEAHFTVRLTMEKTYTVTLFASNPNCVAQLVDADGNLLGEVDSSRGDNVEINNVSGGEWGRYVYIHLVNSNVNSTDCTLKIVENA